MGSKDPGSRRPPGRPATPSLGKFEPPSPRTMVEDRPLDLPEEGEGEVELMLDNFPTEPAPAPAANLLAQAAGGQRTVRGLSGIIHDLRPSVITGGWPIVPLLVLSVVVLLDQADLALTSVLGPDIKDYFGLDITGVLILVQLTVIIPLIAAVPLGYLVDRVRRTAMTAIGNVSLGIFSFFSAVAPTVTLFGVARLSAGLGKAMEAAHFSLLSDYYPPHTRPGVFASQEMARRIARGVTPIIAGVIAAVLFWQAPFLLLGIPALALGYFLLFKLREPVRGEQERRAMGAAEDEATNAERPPSFGEGMRIVWNVRSLRRIVWSLPFLAGAVVGLLVLLSQFYQDVFHLGPAGRGAIISAHELAGIPGLIVGGLVTNRLLRYKPGRVITYGGIMAVLTGLFYGVLAVAPILPLAIAFTVLAGFAGAILVPASSALISLVVPPRARGIGGSLIVTFVIPGIVPIFFIGRVADAHGLRVAILMLVPVFVIGAIIFASAGSSVDADIRAAMAAAMAAYISREAKEQGRAKLLVVNDLDVHYDQVQVLFHVDFEVEEGEIIALLGTNGAGKSTLLRAISGLTVPSNGAIFYDGRDITYLPASEHASLGIIQTPGGRGVFPGLTVAENLRLAAWMFRSDEAYVRQATEVVLGYFPILRERLDEPAGNLSGGEQQMLTLTQAFLSRPRLLMIDELSLGLAPSVVEQLLDIVRAIAELGTTIVLVEQSVNLALTVAKRAVFMEKGEVKFSGSTAELMRRPDILRSVYLKGSAAAGGSFVTGSRQRQAGEDGRETALAVRDVHKSFGGIKAIDGTSFTLREGEILGLIGPNGAGKTTLFDIICGFVEPDRGEILLYGDDITDLGPDQRAKLGVLRSFQDARLFPALTVAENIAVALERHVEVRSTTMAALHLPNVSRSETKLNRRAERLIRLLALGDNRDKFVRELSTGTRRIVDLACMMAADPRVLLLDEPSSGIAQKEAEELGPLLERIKYETGCSMLLIEHDMPLIMSVADELIALDLGTVVTRGRPVEVVEHPQVVASYLGTTEEVIQRSGNA